MGLKARGYIFWKERMRTERFKKLKNIKWFVTYSVGYLDCTIKIETDLINAFTLMWNRW